MSSAVNDLPCTHQCKSTQHGDIITAAISKRGVSDSHLCAFLNYTCTRCESVFDLAGRTALHVAASCGRIDLVRWLVLCRHADINIKDRESGYTALHRSIFYGKIHVAVELIKLGASYMQLDFDGLTSLEHAVQDGLKPKVFEGYGGELYSWGSNTNDVLGPQKSRDTPESLDIFHKEYPDELVQQICIAEFHCVIVTKSGKAYSCGHGQGGRLGLGVEKTVISPSSLYFPESQKGETVTCIQASISRDHSIFLCSDNIIYTCGLNKYYVLGIDPAPEQQLTPKQIKKIPIEVKGVCTGRFHSVAWGPKGIYSWGLNGGQLGHKLNNKVVESYVKSPKLVKLNVEETSIKTVTTSDGATAVCTDRGDIFVLHEYLCRKIASRQLNAEQIGIIGGKLETSFYKEQSKDFNRELKVVVLTNTGNVLIWQEIDQQLCRCIYNINRAIIFKQVFLNMNEILLISDYGEAFQGIAVPRKKRPITAEKNSKNIEKSAFHKFLDKEDCVLVQLKKIPKIHRAIFIESNVKGKDYCAVQAPPYNFYEFPKIIDSEMKKHMSILLEEADENDNIHDIVLIVDNRRFPAHNFIISTKSDYLHKLIQKSTSNSVIFKDLNPHVFEQLLHFVYTGSCELTKCGELKNEHLRMLCHKHSDDDENNVELKPNIPSDISAYEHYNLTKAQNNIVRKTEKGFRNPVRMLHEMAKRFECTDLQKILNNLDMQKYTVKLKQVKDNTGTQEKSIRFNRSAFMDLCDVTVKCRDNKDLKAHKCILAARLEYFNSMFSMRWSANQTSEVTLPFPKTTVEALLEFLYTDSLSYLENKDIDHLFRVLILADQLFVLRLKEQCEMLLTKILTLKNAAQLLTFAHLYNARKLKYCCMKFIVLNITPFLELKSLNELEDDLLGDLQDFYFQEKKEVWCRVITPYSYATCDEKIESIGNSFSVSLDFDFEQSTNVQSGLEKVSYKASHKKKSRTHRSSGSEKNITSIDNNENIDSIIQFPDVSETIIDVKSDIICDTSRIGSIISASRKIQNEKIENKFTKLTPSKGDTSFPELGTSFDESFDFPQLNSPPYHSNHLNNKKLPQKIDSKHKIIRLSQKQRKRLSSESDNPISPIAESPKNPWKVLPSVNASASPKMENTFSINNIILEEKKQKENLVKITSKLLKSTQIEDKAMDELNKFYNCENIMDEIITIERVTMGAIASPVWVPKTK